MLGNKGQIFIINVALDKCIKGSLARVFCERQRWKFSSPNNLTVIDVKFVILLVFSKGSQKVLISLNYYRESFKTD